MNSAVNYSLVTKFITISVLGLFSHFVFLVSVVDKSSGEDYCSIYCIDLVKINNNGSIFM